MDREEDEDNIGSSHDEYYNDSVDQSDESSAEDSSSSSSTDYRSRNRFGLLHRRNYSPANIRFNNLTEQSDSSSSTHSRTRSKKKHFSKRPQHKRNQKTALSNLITECASSKKTSLCCLISIFLWLAIMLYYTDIKIRSHHNIYQPPHLGRLEQSELLRARREQEARAVLGLHGIYHQEKSASWDSQDVSSTRVDKIPKSCSYTDTQTLAFPNCNDIHEIDLREALNIRRHGPIIPAFLGDDQALVPDLNLEDIRLAQKMGYMGSGLWRQVWKVNPRFEPDSHSRSNITQDGSFYAPAVLKMMKQDQPFHERNFDRHRRDALVMERLTSSPHIPNPFGYCGNTVLTEFFGKSLSEVVSTRTSSSMNPFSRNHPLGRIRLALEVMKGIEALHESQDGPIVHADIQIDQFLYDDEAQRIVLNDFNRCRFLPRRNQTGNICKIKIPSAPGGHRSPEEYDLMHIDEKIDIFSAGNVLYTILTGKKPWGHLDRVDIQRNVRMGNTPDIDDAYRIPNSLDAHLANIIENTFETDPRKRKRARDIVQELEILLQQGRSDTFIVDEDH